MPGSNGSREHASFFGSQSEARENRELRGRGTGETPVAREGIRTEDLAVGACGSPAQLAGRATQRSSAALGGTGPAGSNGVRRPYDSPYCIPFDGWRRGLDEVLVAFCRRGREGEREAILAIRGTHPQLAPEIIWARIVYLGLTTSKRPPYLRHEWSSEDVDLLKSGYGEGRNGASRTIDVLRERHPDWSRSVISWKAKSLGLSHKRENGHRPWDEDADRKLISCEGFQMESVEKRMKRSLASIRSRLAELDRGAEFFGGFKTKDLMEMLHFDESAIRRLERKRLLACERGRITQDSVKSLCREHPEEIPFETLDKATKQRLVDDYEYAKPRRVRQGGRRPKEPPGRSGRDLGGEEL